MVYRPNTRARVAFCDFRVTCVMAGSAAERRSTGKTITSRFQGGRRQALSEDEIVRAGYQLTEHPLFQVVTLLRPDKTPMGVRMGDLDGSNHHKVLIFKPQIL